MEPNVSEWLEDTDQFEFTHDDDGGSGSDLDEEIDLDALDASAAASELFAFITSLKFNGTLSAKNACILSWWCHKAGAGDNGSDLAKLGKKPGDTSTGNYSKHFDRVMGVRLASGNFYQVPAACHNRAEAYRTTTDIPAVLPWFAVDEEMRATRDLPTKLEAALADGTLPRAYHDHTVVVSAQPGEIVWPGALFMDAVGFARHDAAIGIWFYNILTGVRTLLAVLRRSELCRCGCRGWDTTFPVLLWLNWACSALAAGVVPSTRHDKRPLSQADEFWSCRAGQSLGYRVAIVYCKQDWAELAHTLGFPTWRDDLHPCPWCWATSADLHDVLGFSALGMPKRSKTMAEYQQACDACEIWVVVDEASYGQLRASLQYEKGTAGCRGRVGVSNSAKEIGWNLMPI